MLFFRKCNALLVPMCFLLVSFSLTGCTSQTNNTVNLLSRQNADEKIIDEENMLNIIEELSSEKYLGRYSGTKGNESASAYISGYFGKIGLNSPEGQDNYSQYYEQAVVLLNSAPRFQLINEQGKAYCEYKYPEDFTFRQLSSSGNAIDLKASLYPVEKLSDIKPENKAIDGKFLLVSSLVLQNMSYKVLSDFVNPTGALGVIVELDITRQNRRYDALPVTSMAFPWNEGAEYKPILDVRDGIFKQLLKISKENQSIMLSCSYTKNEHCKVPNIVGYIPGSAAKLKNEQIILGAHFDAMGNNQNGTFNPGALDNASGTAAIMEIARILKENRTPPKKTIVIIAFNGEEQHLRGSAYYADNPLFPLENSVLINLDMVGSKKKVPITISAGGGKDTGLLKWFCEKAREMDIDTVAMADGICDEMSFAEKGVPVVTLSNNALRSGYHTPNDDINDIDASRLEQYVKLVLQYIDEHAY